MLHDGPGASRDDGPMALKREPPSSSAPSAAAGEAPAEPGRFLIRIPLTSHLKSSLSGDLKAASQPNRPADPSSTSSPTSGAKADAVTIVKEDADWCIVSPGAGESMAANERETGPLTDARAAVAECAKPTSVHLGSVAYEPFKLLFPRKGPASSPSTRVTISIKIPRRYFQEASNPALRKRYLFGGDGATEEARYYTDDSDVVAILLQDGLPLVSGDDALWTTAKATFEIVPSRDQYVGAERHGIKSRSWRRHSGLAIRLLNYRLLRERSQTPQRRPPDAIDVRFSYRLSRPVLPLPLLQFDPAQLVRHHPRRPWELAMEGPRHVYILRCDDGDRDNLRLGRREGRDVEERELFAALRWDEIDWRVEGGLLIRKNFLPIHSYYWSSSAA